MIRKIGILSLSSVTGVATGITTIIPLIAIAYPDYSIASIESLVTVSSLSALITIFLNDLIVRKIGLKVTIILGLTIGMFSGIIPFFISNYYLFLFTRIILGMGIGLYSPHAISLITLFYKGEERTTLLGMQMGITALGNAILLVTSGFLADVDWKLTFFIYLFLGIIAVLIWRYVPDKKIHTQYKDIKKPINVGVKKYILLCFITFLIIWGVQLKIPSYLVEQGISSSERAGIILSTMNIAGMIAGFSFGFCFRKINIYLLPLGFIGAGASVLGMLNSSSYLPIFVFAVLFNFVYSFTGPTIVLKVNQLASEDQLTKVNSMITTTTIISSYAAPFTWNSITSFIDSSENTGAALSIMLISLLAIGALLFLYYGYKNYDIGVKNE